MESHVGQIALVRTHTLLGWLIRAVTRHDYDHVLVGTQWGFVVSPENEGVLLRHITHWAPEDVVWSHFVETEMQHWQVADFAEGCVDLPYNWAADVWITVGLLFRLSTPNWVMKKLDNGKRWQCAQLADASLRAGGVTVFEDDRPPGAVFPGSFVHIFQRRGWL